ncbi:MAG: trigger factor [Rhizobiales bacterium TMED168]|nr:MAG: trigger factor [Rhizobiales bacterium TMED168]|tara:strand:- start:1196 stop:2635 length:1440 start_codon:yes stop_codon:yes gene_type:complete
MDVKEIKSKGLKREFSITIKINNLKEKKSEKLQNIASKAKIDGFRPGKVPTTHIEKLYGQSVMVEVIEERVSEASKNVLEERNLRAAVKPDIKLVSDMNDVIEKNKDLVFTLNCEVLPEIEITDFSKIKLDRPVSEPKEKDIKDALDYLAKQNKSFSDVSESTKSRNGDQVTLDYTGKIDNVAFEGGTAKDANLILGSKSFIDNFEEQLIGLKKGDKKLVKVKFPENYQSNDLAGKKASFEVEIKKVSKAEDSKVNDDLAKNLGMENLDALRKNLKDRIKQDFDSAARMKLKDSLLGTLEKNHSFELPESMVNQEFDQMWSQLEQQLKQQKKDLKDLELSEKEIRKNYTEISEKRVCTGLLIAEIGKQNDIQLDDNDINKALQNEMQKYPGQEKEILDYYQKNQDAIRQLTAPVFEDKVIDFILEKVNLRDVKVSREDLFDSGIKENKKPKKKAKTKSTPASNSKPVSKSKKATIKKTK